MMKRRRETWWNKNNRYHNFQDHKAEELKKEFPVSSGSQHREKEGYVALPAHMHLKLTEDWTNYSTPSRAAAPTTPRFGMKMLTRMGWSPGEGLGKYKEGTLEPIVPEGLQYYSPEELTPKTQSAASLVENLSGKHPVMALTELCAKFKWGAPKYVVVDEEGPVHKKNYIMKVIINGQEFQPETSVASKKQAKADCAALFLESIGLHKSAKPS